MPDRAFFNDSLSLSFFSFFLFLFRVFSREKKRGWTFLCISSKADAISFLLSASISAHVFGHQSGDDFVHERDDGIGKVHLRERNGNGERGGDRRRGVAVAAAETTNYCRFGAHEPRAKDNRVESKHGRERW